MNVIQFSQLIIEPTLKMINLFSPSANVLLLGTSLIESGLEYLQQKGSGPGMGVYQIETPTYEDILRYLSRAENSKLKELCLSSCQLKEWPDNDSLIYNLRWATIIARLKYLMIGEKLPYSFDAAGMAAYYKKYYNTAEGKAELPEVVSIFENIIKNINSYAM